jgi:Stress responsive A/B Barrel Domain
MYSRTKRDILDDTSSASTAIYSTNQFTNLTLENMFVHHVYFWLKNPDSKDDRSKLIEGLRKLSKVKTIKSFHIGQPAGTNREVIDRSYTISWLLFFDNPADQDSYQTDPIHLKFVEECSSLWTKVVVYDTIDI